MAYILHSGDSYTALIHHSKGGTLVARLQGQGRGKTPVILIVLGLIALILLYLFVLAPLLNLPYEINTFIS